MLLVSVTGFAQSTYPSTADETIQKVFDELFSNLDELMNTYDQSESEYYNRIDAVMSPMD